MIDATQIFDGTINADGTITGHLPAAGVTGPSANVIDLGVERDVGAGYKLEVVVSITAAFVQCTSLQVKLQQSPDNATFYDLELGPVVPVADLIIGGSTFRYTIPPNQALNVTAGVPNVPGRYLRLEYVFVGTAETSGKLFSFINPTNDRDQYTSYPKNYTVGVAAGQL